MKRFILLKDTPEYKKGAVFEVTDYECRCINHTEYVTLPELENRKWHYDPEVIVNNPKWYQEVEQLWLTKEELLKVKKLLKLK